MKDGSDLVGPNNADAVPRYSDAMLCREDLRLARINEISGSPYHAAIFRALVEKVTV